MPDAAATPDETWRASGLDTWLAATGFAPASIAPLPGDVSPRRYARVRSAVDGGGAVLAVYPTELRDTLTRFVGSTALLERGGVRVPRLLAVDVARGWVLQEDLGARTLYDLRDGAWERLEPYLDEAAASTRRIAALATTEVVALGSPPLDAPLLAREIEATFERLLLPRAFVLGAEESELRAALRLLCERLGSTPPVPCHRDFMARNLVPLGASGVGVLDHQDLRLGPRWYDLASLANDSLFAPASLVERWLAAAGAGPEDLLDYHRAAAQRGLKAAGTFAAFAERGHPRHLVLVPPTMRRAREHLARTPEGAEIAAALAQRWEEILAGWVC